MSCLTCGTDNKPGRRFCAQCGADLARSCPVCGGSNDPGDLFCGECGNPLDAGAPAAARTARPDSGTTVSERRLVSILFADLVGFTGYSEHRDPEETRDLLSRYFDSARQVIDRYGGTIEKFIGDAVMALWGAPVAREDDAERAVRAGLELVEVVASLESDAGPAGLQARAGVVTGEAAVTVGAEGQGLVAGDLVNTASRVQSLAPPGSVLVGDVTRRATEAAIAYEDAGSHELRGKTEPIALWRAARVVAARRGEGRSGGLEAPFVGREGEFRLIKNSFHAAADERKARLVSVLGIAGIGKSRVSWEFEKYLDGLVDEFRWHRGRCLAYGEGVAYWALAEMVRMRAGIAEQEPASSARAKLGQALERHLPDTDERTWLEPRLAQLLGLGEEGTSDREDLFSAWRLFFERLAEEAPTVLVFEDLQWADAALLDFIEYLLEWSRNHPLFVLTLARPELGDRRPTWGNSVRNFTSLVLEPLSPETMDELLRGLVPGLPDELRLQILDRAEGVPLYAVETVRMLLDRELVTREGSQYAPAGAIESLDVPETLHALVAARLDGLPPTARQVLEDAAVLGKMFTKAGLAALSGKSDDELSPALESLVRKDILSIDTDPRSPERGQYGFVQALMQRIAHETLSRKERKVRHLAAARFLEGTTSSEQAEIVEVVAAHYLDAYESEPRAADAGEIKAKAREALTRAGRRAASVAASAEARRYFEQAAELAEEREEEARLYEEAGEMAEAASQHAEAIELFERAIELFEAEGSSHAAARVQAQHAVALWNDGHIDRAAERMQRSFDILAGDEPDEDLATLAAQLGRLRFFLGEKDAAAATVERSLEIAESLWLPAVLTEALNTKSVLLNAGGRFEEALAALKHALEIALDNDLPGSAMRAYFNLSYQMGARDRFDEATRIDVEGIELARRRGNRAWEQHFLCHFVGNRYWTGEWDEALEISRELSESGSFRSGTAREMVWVLPRIAIHRGRVDEAREALASVPAEPSAEIQERAAYGIGRATVLRAEGRNDDALAAAEEAAVVSENLGRRHLFSKLALVEIAEAALALDDLARVERLLADWKSISPASRTSFVDAQLARFEARLAIRRGDSATGARLFKTASGILRELPLPFWLAVSLLEQGEALVTNGDPSEAEPILSEAKETLESLGASAWLERLASARPEAAALAAPLGSAEQR
ncbi:MAG: AAA family ATPase [Actinomycetota bacterium]|nr:AAA family ATPase [Actinomycetota bacterium]